MNSTAATFLLNTTPSTILTTTEKRSIFSPNKSISRTSFQVSRASSQYSSSIADDFNLYELLGIDSASDKLQIKEAYRALQKRCHPDIAGPPGHDMAIVLNEAYALLSDPISKMVYDKELAKVSDLQGFTGKPLYSAWYGPETEQRAVFVDEVKCVGCLKCALFAEKTFAVESVYGRARVVAQWADPENRILDAIATCPVDCISMVERSNLAALEFIMSKQPRGKVRVGASNTAGIRTADVFDEVEKFQARYAKHKASTVSSKESEANREMRMSAIQAIQMISNWIYWKTPNTDSTPSALQHLARGTTKHSEPTIKRLKAAAEARKQPKSTTQQNEPSSNTNEYWKPLALELPQGPVTLDYDPKPTINPSHPSNNASRSKAVEFVKRKEDKFNPLKLGVPIGAAVIAGSIVRSHLGEPIEGIKDHVGGSLALAIVNSQWMPVILAGVTWFLIGMYAVELVEAVRRK